MPTYTLINTETGDEFNEFCSWDDLEIFLKANPKFKQKVSAPALVGDHIGGVGPKVDNGFKVVNPEGYVAIDKTGGAVKIVDKLEFSFNNFTVAKNWDK